MAYTSLPTVAPGDPTRASWGNLVDSNLDDHESRIVDLETILGSPGSPNAGTGDVTGPGSSTDNAIVRFDGTGGTAIQDSGITIADGASGTLSGSNSGDVTLSGTPDYLTIAGQTITRNPVDLAADVMGDLPLANVAPSAAATRLLGRGSAGGAGDWEPISLGTNLSMAGTTLNASGGGAGALDDLSDVAITTPAANDVLQYNGSSFVNQPAANLNASNLASGTIPDARMPDLTGDVTTSVGAVATTIANDAVTYAKMQNISAASKLLGRGSAAGSGDPQEITLGTNLSMSGTTLNASAVSSDAALVGITIDGGGSVITTGVKGFLVIPKTGTITKATLLSTDAAATAGSIVIDVWKDTYANYPPDNSDSITASAPPTLSSANKSQDSTLTGWTTAVTAGDVLGFNVDSATTVTRVTLVLEITP